MVHYNGHLLVGSFVLVGRTFRNHAKAWFFLCAQANLYAVSYNTALGALLEKEPFSDESGSFFMLFRRCFGSKMSKIRTKSIYC